MSSENTFLLYRPYPMYAVLANKSFARGHSSYRVAGREALERVYVGTAEQPQRVRARSKGRSVWARRAPSSGVASPSVVARRRAAKAVPPSTTAAMGMPTAAWVGFCDAHTAAGISTRLHRGRRAEPGAEACRRASSHIVWVVECHRATAALPPRLPPRVHKPAGARHPPQSTPRAQARTQRVRRPLRHACT